MAAVTARRGEPLPRSVVWVGGPVAGVLLVAFFVYLGFPYDRLAEWVAWRASQAAGVQLAIGALEPRLGWLPGFEAHDVRVVKPEGRRTDLERVWLRPAWSLSWLRAAPAFYAEVDAPLGSGAGVVWPGGSPAFEGELRGVDLAELPLGDWVGGVDVQGRLDADLAVHVTEEGRPEGTVSFVATAGTLAHPALPLPIPFDALQGELALGEDEQLAALETLTLQGPLVSGEARGTLGAADDPLRAPLDLEVRIDARDRSMRSVLSSFGARPGRDGSATFRVTGTLGAPIVQ